jgi:alpha-1,2-mannosyltransferase
MTDRSRVRAVLLGAAFCLLAAGLGFYVAGIDVLRPWHGESDFAIYRGAVVWWSEHRPLYSFRLPGTRYGFTYPPFAAYAMRPWAWLTLNQGMVLNGVATVLVLVGIVRFLIAPVAARHGWPPRAAVVVAVPLAYFLDPVRETIGLGQVNLYLAALVLADLAALRRGSRLAGVGIGLATAIKLTPGLFIPYLLLTGRGRAAATAAGTFAAAGAVAFLLDPATSVRFWTDTLFQTSRVGPAGAVANQSLLGLLTRVVGPDRPESLVWAAAGAVLVVGLARAWRAHCRGDELVAFTLTGLTACLVSPISWTHHLFWIVPAEVVLVDLAAGTPTARWRHRPRAIAAVASVAAVAVFVVFSFSVVWYFSTHAGFVRGHDAATLLGADAYALVMLALLLLPARRTPQLPADHDGRGGRPEAGRRPVEVLTAASRSHSAPTPPRGPRSATSRRATPPPPA